MPNNDDTAARPSTSAAWHGSVIAILVARGETDPLSADPLTSSLTAAGRQQANRAAQALGDLQIDLLCAASDIASAEAADILADAVPPQERWDLADLEALNRDDLALEPTGSPMPARWSPDQWRFGLERLWVRVTPAWTRIAIYAEAQGLAHVMVVADPLVLTLLLQSWQGRDWRALGEGVAVAPGEALRVALGGASVSVQPFVG
jgi:broad specificity phosphatase PhoE